MMGAASAGVPLRWLRALVLAGVALLTGATAHAAGGGNLPGTDALLVMLVLVTVVAAPLLRREASVTRVIVMLVVAQSAIHVALTTAAGHAGQAGHAVASAHGGSHAAAGHAQAQAQSDLVPISWTEHLLSQLTADNLAMVATHLIAAALVGAWLAAGERAVWTLITLAATTLLGSLHTAILVWAQSRVAVVSSRPRVTAALLGDEDRRGLRVWLLWRAVSRRGPPLGCPAV